MMFLKTLLLALAMIFVPIQGTPSIYRKNTTVGLYRDGACNDFIMDMEVWTDTCANWMHKGFHSIRLNRRSSTWHQIIHTFTGPQCTYPPLGCVDNKHIGTCMTWATGETAYAINSWGLSMDGDLCH
ncbi:hypothetical protein QBC39DRAFT_383362 [Podospora conica]|nr:hypothetical protein QBC39DRAFT_383362 [Schizothecium conicum]